MPKANSLGMTETLGPHTFDSKDNTLPPEKDGSFGFSVPGVEHKIVDPVTVEDCRSARPASCGSAATRSCWACTSGSGPTCSRPTAGTAPATAATSTPTATSISPAGWAISSSRPA